MAIYIVTGKLGGGKTLGAVSQINEFLRRGLRIATNLDLRLVELPSCNRHSKKARVIRLPDRPSVDDIKAIGFGIEGVTNLSEARESYDESKFGALVLDECGTWLNSRDWQAEGRRELINFMLHIRKHLWHVYLIIQDISMLDKQARKALAEHVVYCRRTDRMSIPFIGTVYRWATGDQLTLPKMHIGHVKYGDQPTSLDVHKWKYRGGEFYRAYDTTQVFSEDYEHGVFSVLPPWYQYQHMFTKWTWRNRVRLTKVYLRKYSLATLLAAGMVSGVAVARMLSPDVVPEVVESEEGEAEMAFEVSEVGEGEKVVVSLVSRLKIGSVFTDFDGRVTVKFSDGNRNYYPDELEAVGIGYVKVGSCQWKVFSSSESKRVDCWG